MLTKTDFCSGAQCVRKYWLAQNKPEEAVNNKDDGALRNGRIVGEAAIRYFKADVIVQFGSQEQMVKETEFYLDHNEKVIAEASFMSDEGFCSVDILINHGDKKVELYEVKSSKTTDEIKEIYKYDVAFQYRVLTRAGYDVLKACLVTINGDYVRQGEVNGEELFSITDMTEDAIARWDEIGRIIESLKAEEEPNIDISMRCFDKGFHNCGFFDYCFGEPHPNIFDVAAMQTRTKFKYLKAGARTFKDLENVGIKDNYLMQIRHELNDLPPEVDMDGIEAFLSQIRYPLYFLDFETVNPAVPLFDNSHPYQQIVFQYSLHYYLEKGGELMHDEYIGWPGEDPRRPICERLCKMIPDDACVIVYNKAFEQTRLKEMAELYPDLSEKLLRIRDNVVDLMEPFKHRLYYVKAMKGSASIKDVLPALYPDDEELNYSNLEGVHHGGEAIEAFYLMANASEEKLKEYRKQLFRYCWLDTYATVRVLEFLQNLKGD